VKTPKIIPASYPDTVADVAEGATFYLDADGGTWTGEAFLMTSVSHLRRRKCVRLRDGRVFNFAEQWQVRVIALSAQTVDDRW
jgi:hypothetical protein